MADLENGLFSGESASNNAADPSISYRFVTAIVKGEPDQVGVEGEPRFCCFGQLDDFLLGH
jgi:hypothetical protein